MNLGTLKEITNLREIWPHEALNLRLGLLKMLTFWARLWD